jgi:hypothetical protein
MFHRVVDIVPKSFVIFILLSQLVNQGTQDDGVPLELGPEFGQLPFLRLLVLVNAHSLSRQNRLGFCLWRDCHRFTG